MSRKRKGLNSGVNQATSHGAQYNKLTRPDNFIARPTETPPSPPPLDAASLKRKDFDMPDYEPSQEHKRRRRNTSSPEPSDHREEEEQEEELHAEDEGEVPSKPLTPVPAKLLYNRKLRQGEAYGQRSAFGELDLYSENDEFSDSSTNEALKYLRAVRAEAGPPQWILRTPAVEVAEGERDVSIYDTGRGDSRGYYQDGAYIAAPVMGPAQPTAYPTLASDDDPDDFVTYLYPQEAYSIRLTSLFHRQRRVLHSTPPAAAFAALTEAQFISFPSGSKDAYKDWKRTLTDLDPSPVHLAALETWTVLRVLRLATGMLKRRRNVEQRLSRWVWGLLCRLDDVGLLDNDQVFVVRELGKRAVWVLEWVAKMEQQNTEDLDDDQRLEDEDAEGQADSKDAETPATDPDEATALEAAKARLLSIPPSISQTSSINSQQEAINAKPLDACSSDEISLQQTENNQAEEKPESSDYPNSNTRATLDMIIMIVGEVYGQRDLLRSREEWRIGI